MATLREQLNDLYPELLPREAPNAINGTELLALVKDRLIGEYADASIRQHFSDMVQDPTSSIAKVANRHGYYLRSAENKLDALPAPLPEESISPQISQGRETQPEEKFRAILIRHARLANQFPMHIEHTRAARRDAGVNQWKFPDVIILKWEGGKLTDSGIRLDADLLAVKTSLGEPLFALESIELKVELSLSTFRENFFQCVSNSKWAHSAVLAIANDIDDQILNAELRRLGASYDVSILSYGLSTTFLNSLPNAQSILNMSAEEFDRQIAGDIRPTRISTGKERVSLDWEHFNDLSSLNPDFVKLIKWISYCLSQKRAYNLSDFEQIQSIQEKTA